MAKKLSKFTKKITRVDVMMIHNFVKYLVQTKSSLDKIFYKIIYHHIIYMCDFFGEFRRHFLRGLHGFSRNCGFHQIRSLFTMLMLIVNNFV